MKAFVVRSYGPPDRLEPTQLDTPVPGDDEVQVRVLATSVNPYDWHGVRGEPYVARLMAGDYGLRRPKFAVPGCDMAGRVTAVGRGVTRLQPGDEVFALMPHGGFAEYVAVREDLVALKPKNPSFEQAAAVPMAAVTALLAVCDKGRVEPGQRVLVNGASGGVGTFAVQIAHTLGAVVTGVCSAQNGEMVRSLGADMVIDYCTEDFTSRRGDYDLVVDSAGSRAVSACRRALTRTGTLVVVGGPPGRWFQPAGRAAAAMLAAPLASQRIRVANAVGCQEKRQNLVTLTELIEDGRLTPVIDRQYPFEQIPAAVQYQEQGHAPGKVAVTV